MAGVGCATQDSTSGEHWPDDDRRTTVARPSITTPANAAIVADTQTRPQPSAPIEDLSADRSAETAPAEAGILPDEIGGGAENPQSPCVEPMEGTANWLDRSQTQVYKTVCDTAVWFDGFFGSNRYDAASGKTYGRLGLSGFRDQYDGFDMKLRLRAKFELPALEDRAALMIGRGDEKDFIEERKTPSDSIPSNFNQIEDEAFLIGLGYQRGNGLKRGISFSVGAKIRAPPEPYAKVRYRRAWDLSNSTLLQLRPVGYWKSEEGFGSTLHVDIDRLLSDDYMLRWTSSGNISEDKEIEGLAWTNWLSLYHAFADRRAISYHAFVLGETRADVKTQNYGVEVRYRRRIARQWLFFEIVSSVSWPRYLIEENRDINWGFGAGFEMYFGPVPDAQIR
ncbi:MAG: hypothetical protein QF483_09265 [Gammaproteobacteria bacterium]|nr:hypothetical protein [Chromatiales bacterium]MCP4927122.1 hypothetical protein [Gammaproteobacteria bacterium]MDP7093523.1 hypothetical protein [Gammaproteobacteria bacterium]MDP7420060.1 hypothetical protein [Gammaproteobacteria bacterium]HJP38906.1 hypothetical protein [Gammaproteobacteria bacterium]